MLDETITLDEAIKSLRSRPGLVYGPSATTEENSFSIIVESAFNGMCDIGETIAENLLKLEDLRASSPETAEVIEGRIHESLKTMPEAKDISYLVQAGWSMCISLTLDVQFEKSLQNYHDSLPTSKTITIVDHQSIKPQARTIPIYKLLGYVHSSLQSHSLAITESELILRKYSWPHILGSCTDFLQGEL